MKEIYILAPFFNEKRERHFIPLPWKIGEMKLKNITHINEILV